MNKNNEYIGGTHFINSLPSQKPRQLEAIKPKQAPHLILAGAGMTTTISARIAYMVEKEALNPSNPPENLKYLCSYK